jgi:hypothetical protein
MAWGLDYVKGGGKDLAEAVKGFDRADFLLWFMVKADALPIEAAFDLLIELARARLDNAIHLAGIESADKTMLQRARGACASEAETLMTTGNYRGGHALTVGTFLIRMRMHFMEVDLDQALKDGQCVLNNLVAARTGSLNFGTADAHQEHAGLCTWLRNHVIVPAGRV